jgi:hypothetical protein
MVNGSNDSIVVSCTVPRCIARRPWPIIQFCDSQAVKSRNLRS